MPSGNVVNFRLDDQTRHALDERAKAQGWNRSQMLQYIIQRYLDIEDQQGRSIPGELHEVLVERNAERVVLRGMQAHMQKKLAVISQRLAKILHEELIDSKRAD